MHQFEDFKNITLFEDRDRQITTLILFFFQKFISKTTLLDVVKFCFIPSRLHCYNAQYLGERGGGLLLFALN